MASQSAGQKQPLINQLPQLDTVQLPVIQQDDELSPTPLRRRPAMRKRRSKSSWELMPHAATENLIIVDQTALDSLFSDNIDTDRDDSRSILSRRSTITRSESGYASVLLSPHAEVSDPLLEHHQEQYESTVDVNDSAAKLFSRLDLESGNRGVLQDSIDSANSTVSMPASPTQLENMRILNNALSVSEPLNLNNASISQKPRRSPQKSSHSPLKPSLSAPMLPTGSSKSPNDAEFYPILGRYMLMKTIGRGTFSVVKLGRHVETGKQYALKIMSKKTLRRVARLQNSVWSEISLMRILQCKHIVGFVESIETSTHLCIVMEAVCGGDMYEFVETHKLSEAMVTRLFMEIAQAVEFLHLNHVAHRDLKLENVFLTSDQHVKIGDFGLATKFKEGQLLFDRCGSEEYAAPELILGKPYDGRAVDIWALGVILYTMLSGKLPFSSEEGKTRQMFTKICISQYTMPDNISADAKSLIAAMLDRNSDTRATIAQVVSHSFVRKIELNSTK